MKFCWEKGVKCGKHFVNISQGFVGPSYYKMGKGGHSFFTLDDYSIYIKAVPGQFTI
jgi:hypothetical protein